MISECLVVDVRVTGDECPLADASAATGSSIDAAPPLLRADDNALLRFSAGTPEIGEHLDADDRVRYLHRAATDATYTFRCLSKAPCVVHELIDVGFLVEAIRYTDGTERYEGAVVGQDVLQGVIEAAKGTGGVSVERISPLGASGDAPVATQWNLTPKQAAALRAAHERGYFEVPKEATASDVADSMGISQTAFLERIRRGQAAMLGQLFE